MTLDEIKVALEGNTEFKNGVLGLLEKDSISYLTSKGMKVRSIDQEQSFLDSYKNTVIEQEIPQRVRQVHDQYDADLLELTGDRKNSNEKTYDFLKRKIKEIKDTSSKVSDPVLKQQNEQLLAQIEETKTAYETKIKQIETDSFSKEVDLLVSGALEKGNIATPLHLKTDEEKQQYINMQKNMLKMDLLKSLKPTKDKDGNVVFFEGDKPLISAQDGKATSASDIISSRYASYFIKAQQQQGGAGTGGGAGASGKFATKAEVFKYVEEKGVSPRSKAFYDESEKLIKEHGIIE